MSKPENGHASKMMRAPVSFIEALHKRVAVEYKGSDRGGVMILRRLAPLLKTVKLPKIDGADKPNKQPAPRKPKAKAKSSKAKVASKARAKAKAKSNKPKAKAKKASKVASNKPQPTE